ncbi:MAG: DNA polymerase IV, partial [Clostridia bacterium]
MKKPDAITVIPRENFKEIIWNLPACDLLGVGRSTKKSLDLYSIYTIGDLACAPEKLLQKKFGKNGLALKRFANGQDISRVAPSDFEVPVKSIGHGITTIQDLENSAEVWCVMLGLVQDVSTKLRKHKKKASGVAISIKNNQLQSREWQCKIDMPTQSSIILAKRTFDLFMKNYVWNYPVRSVTVRAINLIEQDTPLQCDFFTDMSAIDKREKLDLAVENIRYRFGKDAVKNAV